MNYLCWLVSVRTTSKIIFFPRDCSHGERNEETEPTLHVVPAFHILGSRQQNEACETGIWSNGVLLWALHCLSKFRVPEFLLNIVNTMNQNSMVKSIQWRRNNFRNYFSIFSPFIDSRLGFFRFNDLKIMLQTHSLILW